MKKFIKKFTKKKKKKKKRKKEKDNISEFVFKKYTFFKKLIFFVIYNDGKSKV